MSPVWNHPSSSTISDSRYSPEIALVISAGVFTSTSPELSSIDKETPAIGNPRPFFRTSSFDSGFSTVSVAAVSVIPYDWTMGHPKYSSHRSNVAGEHSAPAIMHNLRVFGGFSRSVSAFISRTNMVGTPKYTVTPALSTSVRESLNRVLPHNRERRLPENGRHHADEAIHMKERHGNVQDISTGNL